MVDVKTPAHELAPGVYWLMLGASNAELARRTGAAVLVHAADAPYVQGQPGPAPTLTELELPLARMLFGETPNLPGPPAPPVANPKSVQDGHLTLGGGRFIAVPGHTPGSTALLLQQQGVLFTGDTIASTDGAPILGPFNIDRASAVDAVRKQAQLEFDIACVGHGAPIVGSANRKVLAMIRSF